MSKATRRPLVLVGLALAALAIAGCAPSAPAELPTPQPQATSTPIAMPIPRETEQPAAPPATPTPAPTPFQGTRNPVSREQPPAPPTAQLVDVRVGRNQGFDRIVFEFEGNVPGYRIAYVDPPIREDGSGDVLEVQGQAFLEARFEPASGWDFDRNAPSYPGPRTVSADLPTLVEAERSGDFEAVLTWAIGLRQAVDFRVIELADPLRVVIDVAH